MKNRKYVILIVEDDVKLQETLKQFLTNNQYEVMCANDGEQALELYYSYNHQIDLILLDVMLPMMDGYEVLRRVRDFSSVPVIMGTSRDTEEDQLEGLRGGADNYITKPFRLRVLLAHMENLLKKNGKDTEFRVGMLTIIIGTRSVLIDGQEIDVTPKEFDFPLFFIRHQNQVLSREVILDSVWGFDYEGNTRTVDTLVKQLRKKLTDKCPFIHSVYGIGYCFKEG